MNAPIELVRDAFGRAREGCFPLARLAYPVVFGSRWPAAMLAFAYFRLLDDVVDEEPRRDRALAILARQRALMRRVYAGARPGRLPRPDCYGARVFAADCRRGAPLRPAAERLLESMAFDTRRRGRRLSSRELDAYVLALGEAVAGLFVVLAKPGVVMPREFVRAASRAYLYADAAIDVREDLARGVINISRQDLARFRLSGASDDPRLPLWTRARGRVVRRYFDEARRELGGVEPWPVRVAVGGFLAVKGIKLARALAGEDQAATAARGSDSR